MRIGLATIIVGLGVIPGEAQVRPTHMPVRRAAPDVGAVSHLVRSAEITVPLAIRIASTGSIGPVTPMGPLTEGRTILASEAGIDSDRGGSGADDAYALPDASAGVWEIVIGACAGGAFLAAYTAGTATSPAAATGVGAAGTGAAIVSAAAVGCSLGAATAMVGFGAIAGWKSLQSQ